MRRLGVVIVAAVALVGAAACSSGSKSASTSTSETRDTTTTSSGAGVPTTAPSSGSAPLWPTYHRTNDRNGLVPGFPAPTRLPRAWNVKLDGAVYAQPVVVGDQVIVATENDTVYALDVSSGAQRWMRHLASPIRQSDLPCGDIDPLGITGTPAYDDATRSMFVVTETAGGRHDLYALDPTNGATRFTRNLDVTNRDPRAEQQRAALLVANGRVYVAFGGLFGDCGNYVGYVTALATDGSGTITHYEVPTSREGGIWAASGPAAAADGTIYVAVGNGASTGGSYDGSDSVLRLAPDLSRRLDFFAPSNWGSENAQDADLGSTGPLLVPGNRVLIGGKGSQVYLLDASRLGGIGGQLSTVNGCRSFGGMAFDAGAAFVPCSDGVLRVDVQPGRITRSWQARGISGSPVVGGGEVWTLDTSSGVLHALDEATGHERASASVGDVTRFASPVLAGGRVVVGTTGGVVALTVQ
ncbi:MAG TPA: PQQ-binding-like beta-propeller repeat protein [Acidimicrobiia bacterium]|nr:PQQ-binding-like beta-propeller repeat protein [Acidimicrobiia bacterium]